MQLDADRKKVSVFAEKILHNGPPKCECMDCIWQVVPGEDVMRPGPAVAEIIEKLIAEMTPELHLIEAEEFYPGMPESSSSRCSAVKSTNMSFGRRRPPSARTTSRHKPSPESSLLYTCG